MCGRVLLADQKLGSNEKKRQKNSCVDTPEYEPAATLFGYWCWLDDGNNVIELSYI